MASASSSSLGTSSSLLSLVLPSTTTSSSSTHSSLALLSAETLGNQQTTSSYVFSATPSTSSSLSSSFNSSLFISSSSSTSSSSSKPEESKIDKSLTFYHSEKAVFTMLEIDPLKKHFEYGWKLHEFMRMKGQASLEDCRKNFVLNSSEASVSFRGKTYVKCINKDYFDKYVNIINLAWIKMNLDIDLFSLLFPNTESQNKYETMLNSLLSKYNAKCKLTFQKYPESKEKIAAVIDTVILGVGTSEVEAAQKAVEYIRDCFEKIYIDKHELIAEN